jgi:transposase
MDGTYLLGLEFTAPGGDCSVWSECRDRLRDSHAQALWLATRLERCRALGWLTARGQPRTASTHVLAAIRGCHRHERVADTWRATLHALATGAPDWRRGSAPVPWYERYSTRLAEAHIPQDETTGHA